MSKSPPIRPDYPLMETARETVRTATGKRLSDFTVEAVVAGNIVPDDLLILPETLLAQAEVALAAGKDQLAENFRRAAEMTAIPQDVLLATYELLRPGRANGIEDLHGAASDLRTRFGVNKTAALIEEAAEAYAKRGLFTKRF